MKNCNKRGFTLAELAIVIACAVVLAAILIPVTLTLYDQANTPDDVVLVQQLNSLLAESEDDDIDFDDALAIAKAEGFDVAELNADEDRRYFVFDGALEQFILVDGKNCYEVIYAASETDSKNWNFATGSFFFSRRIASAGYDVRFIASSAEEVAYAIAYAPKKEVVSIYVDENLALEKSNVIKFYRTNTDFVIELGDRTISSSLVNGKVPVTVTRGQVTVEGGVITASGTSNGLLTNAAVLVEDGAMLNFNGTVFNINAPWGAGLSSDSMGGNAVTYDGGDGSLTGVTINSSLAGLIAADGSQVHLIDSTVVADFYAIIARSFDRETNSVDEENVTNVFVKSGSYKSTLDMGATVIATESANILISGGTFENTAEGGKLFMAQDGEIIITAGSFVVEGEVKAFADMTEEDWNKVASGVVEFEKNTDGVVTKVIVK